MSQSTVNDLFQTAVQDGDLSVAALDALQIAPDMGAQIQQGMGVNVDDVQASEVVLVNFLLDDSGSIWFVAGNEQAVRDGHNSVIKALKGSKQGSNILAHTQYLNGKVLYPYVLLENAILMDKGNYQATGGTPLYDQTAVILGRSLAKTQEFSDNSVPVRSITLILTDGADAGSVHYTPKTLKPLVEDMFRSERHIVAAMGIDDGGHTDFRHVFKEMGIPDQWILTPKNSDSEIRAAFMLFSQSAVRASQNAASFSKTALGGFGG